MGELAAMIPLADSYEDIFIVMRKLGLSNNEFAEQFRRLVFVDDKMIALIKDEFVSINP